MIFEKQLTRVKNTLTRNRIPFPVELRKDRTSRQTEMDSPAKIIGLLRDRTLTVDYSNVALLETYWKIFKNEAPIRGAIEVLTNATISNGWEVKTVDKGDVDKESEEVKTITKWLNDPLYEFHSVLRDIVLNLLIYDHAFLELTPHKNDKTKLGWMYTLDSRFCNLQLTDDGKKVKTLLYQLYSSPNEKAMPYKKPPSEGSNSFVYAAMNRLGSIRGLSPLESLIKNVNVYNAIMNYNQDLFDGNGILSYIFALKKGNKDDFKRLVENVKERKTGESLTVTGEVDAQSLGQTGTETAYSDMINQVYQDTMTVYSVPPVMMNIMGLKSGQEASREGSNAFALKIDSIQLFVNNLIDQAIRLIWGPAYQKIRFNLKPWINEKARAAIHDIYLKHYVMTINDVRAEKGLKKLDWGDEPFFPNYLPQLLDKVSWDELKQQDKAPGENDQAPGRSSDVERPQNQGSETDQLKELIINLSEVVSKQAEMLEATHKAEKLFAASLDMNMDE
jgi:hypothetical protein